MKLRAFYQTLRVQLAPFSNLVTDTLFLSLRWHVQELFSDVGFRVEGALIPAHKIVLCLHCEVMSAMLTGGFRESQSNEVKKFLL